MTVERIGVTSRTTTRRWQPSLDGVPTPLAVMTMLGFAGASLVTLGLVHALVQGESRLTTSWGSTTSAAAQAAVAIGIVLLCTLTFWRDRRSWLLLMSSSVCALIVGVTFTKNGGAAMVPELVVLALPSTRAYFADKGPSPLAE